MKQWAERAHVSATEIDSGHEVDSTLPKCVVDVGKWWAGVSALSSLTGDDMSLILGNPVPSSPFISMLDDVK